MEIEESSLVYLPADCRKILDSMQSKRVEGKAGAEGRGQVSTRERERVTEGGGRPEGRGHGAEPIPVGGRFACFHVYAIFNLCSLFEECERVVGRERENSL